MCERGLVTIAEVRRRIGKELGAPIPSTCWITRQLKLGIVPYVRSFRGSRLLSEGSVRALIANWSQARQRNDRALDYSHQLRIFTSSDRPEDEDMRDKRGSCPRKVAAEYLSQRLGRTVSPGTLAQMAHRKVGPAYRNVGKHSQYTYADLDAWLAEQLGPEDEEEPQRAFEEDAPLTRGSGRRREREAAAKKEARVTALDVPNLSINPS